MKFNKGYWLAGLVATALVGGLAIASTDGPDGYENTYLQRGPIPFEAFDKNRDGRLSAEEFYDVRAARQAYRAKQGYRLRRAAHAPSFAIIDTDGDGTISPDEHAAHHAVRSQSRPCMQFGKRW